MRVLADVDEADVGRIRDGLRATFTVDSFANQTFSGEVMQVRKAPQVLQNVVTYDVVISAQDSTTNAGLIPIAKQQVTAAEEALHITQQNFEAGTALFLDILQAQDAVLAARLNYANAITSEFLDQELVGALRTRNPVIFAARK